MQGFQASSQELAPGARGEWVRALIAILAFLAMLAIEHARLAG